MTCRERAEKDEIMKPWMWVFVVVFAGLTWNHIGNRAGYARGFRAGVEATIAEVDRQAAVIHR